MERKKIIVQLRAGTPVIRPLEPQVDRVRALRKVVDEARQRFEPLLETLKRIDPTLNVSLDKTILPLLSLTLNQTALEELRTLAREAPEIVEKVVEDLPEVIPC